MVYHFLKLIHILVAAAFITSLIYCIGLWFQPKRFRQREQTFLKQTALIIIPCLFIQLFLGLTMIDLKGYPLSWLWIKGSVFGSMMVSISWLAFVWLSWQAEQSSKARFRQGLALVVCMITVLGMIFLMANQSR